MKRKQPVRKSPRQSMKYLQPPHYLKYSRFSKVNLLIFILIFAGIGGYVLLHSFAATTQTTANLWVDTTGGSCTRQATAGAYNDAGACSSMQAAMTAAQAGDRVIVKCGAYPSQTISTGTKSTAVSFYAETYDQAATAADAYSATSCATVASLSLNGVDKIHIYGIQATPAPDNSRTDAHLTYAYGGSLGICASGCASTATTDILIDGFHGRNFFGYVTNVVIDHSSFGGWDACYDTAGNHLASGNSGTEDGFRFWSGTGGSGTPTNSVLRNSVIHDIIMGVNDSELGNVCTYGSTYGPHADCMQNNGGAGITIENNIFFNCPSSDIQWNPFGSATIGTQTIQNNYFGPIGGIGNGTVLGAQSGSSWDCSNIIVRNNLYNGVGINFENAGCAGGVGGQIYSNIFAGDCWSSQGSNYHDNIFETPNTCGTNATVCTPVFANTPPTSPNWLATATPNFHLASSDTCAKDHGYTTYPPTDFEGDTRPQGTLSDAGPDEVVSGNPPVGDLNSDGQVNITDLSIMLSNWGTTNSTCDLNTNGSVDIFDLSILLSHYGV
ncbi:MAG TPA: dockerin type I domain-containing protein [Candidatus Saccharimonadales bacterium]|nr:dockerin type I domain-containing protein [Candidatus Saccharimonadales bacterium]